MLKEKQQLENLRRQQKTSGEATQRLKEKLSELSRRRQQIMEEKDASLSAKEKVWNRIGLWIFENVQYDC